MIRAVMAFFRLLPSSFDRAHLEWARAHLSKHNPMHKDLPYIVNRLRELKEQCRAT